MFRFARAFVPLVPLGLAACGALLGIEDRDVGDPRADGGVVAPPGDVDASIDSVAPATGPVSLVPPRCAGSPKDNTSILVDECGVFVSPQGVDSNPGTRAAPKLTLKAAVTAALSLQRYRVFACTGTYAERITLGNPGANIVGGLTCAGGTWAVGGAPSVIRPVDDGAPTVLIDKTQNPIELETLHIESIAAVKPGGASIAVQVTQGANVRIVTSEIVAGSARTGEHGSHGELAAGGGEGGNAAGTPNTDSPGTQKSCQCTFNGADLGTTVGGAGSSSSGGAQEGLPAMGGGEPGGNGDPANGIGCSNGGTGARGESGDAGTPPNTPGVIKDGVWVATAGADGTPGRVGQGGGGGGAYDVYAGGSGGCGGCPSMGGHGGQGGGASIGIVMSDSGLMLVSTSIQTSQAGAGGPGGNNSDSATQPGGQGEGNAQGNGCAGGQGGSGGTGGSGGGGAGGSSIGIAYRGPTPNVDAASDAKFTIGAVGLPGIGRIPGPKRIGPGPVGVSQKIYSPM